MPWSVPSTAALILAGLRSATATGTDLWTLVSARSMSLSPSCGRDRIFPSGSKSQVSRMAADLDQVVDEFRHRPLGEAGPFTFVAADALTMKVREGGRVVASVVLIATGVNADGRREVLGLRVATSETGPAWNTFLADLVARGLSGVKLVTSDAHAGLKQAIAPNLPGATWQRCRTRYAFNLMGVTPKSMWPAVKAMLHSVYDQPDAPAVFPTSPSTSPAPGKTSSRSRPSPKDSGNRSGPTTPTSDSIARSAAAPTALGSSQRSLRQHRPTDTHTGAHRCRPKVRQETACGRQGPPAGRSCLHSQSSRVRDPQAERATERYRTGQGSTCGSLMCPPDVPQRLSGQWAVDRKHSASCRVSRSQRFWATGDRSIVRSARRQGCGEQ